MVGLKVILIIVAVVLAGLLSLRLAKREGRRGEEETVIGFRMWGAVAGAALVLLAIILAGAIGQIDPGYRGVVVRLGAMTGTTLGEGAYMVAPIVDSVELMDVQTHAYEAEAGAASKDLQDVHTKVTLNYALDPTKVNVVYQTLRRDYIGRIIKPAVQESVKAITARFDAEKLITQRPEVKSAIEDALKDRLALHGIISETISMTDFQFSKSFMDAIEAKQVAVQDALKAENKLRQIEVEARQVETAARGQANAAIATAEGQKRSAILKSEGEASAKLTVAEAETKANKMLGESLRGQPELLKYILYQKIGDDIKVIILPSGQEFILGSEVLGK